MRLLSTITFAVISIITFAQRLNDGDILFTSIQSDNYDSFTFVATQDITANTIIYFTDDAIDSLRNQRGSEGTITWTAPDHGVKQGEVVTIEKLDGFITNQGTITTRGAFVLATTGDQIFAYQVIDSDTSYIAAINFNTNKSWITSGEATAGKSYRPNNLESIISFRFHRDNGTYELCSSDTTPISIIKQKIINTDNWLMSDEPIQEYCTSFILPTAKSQTKKNIKIYPNPILNGKLNFSKRLTNIKIINNVGAIVFSTEKAASIDIQNLPTGIYYLNTTEGNTTFVIE